eukprot:6422015-Prymnesium_polylepis.2
MPPIRPACSQSQTPDHDGESGTAHRAVAPRAATRERGRPHKYGSWNCDVNLDETLLWLKLPPCPPSPIACMLLPKGLPLAAPSPIKLEEYSLGRYVWSCGDAVGRRRAARGGEPPSVAGWGRPPLSRWGREREREKASRRAHHEGHRRRRLVDGTIAHQLRPRLLHLLLLERDALWRPRLCRCPHTRRGHIVARATAWWSAGLLRRQLRRAAHRAVVIIGPLGQIGALPRHGVAARVPRVHRSELLAVARG